MKISYLVAETPGIVQLKTREYDPANLGPDQVLVANKYSAISAGTERAWITGKSNNVTQRFPFHPGYSAAGVVEAVGSEVTEYKPGDRVLINWHGHCSHAVCKCTKRFLCKIEDDSIDLKHAAFGLIASFPMLGVRRLKVEPGESVMIAGLGILGMIALQFARLSGACPLIAADPDPARRKLALELGADAVLDPLEPDYIEQVKALTGGKGVNATVEVTGIASALQQAVKYTAHLGRISLLGCTRVPDAPIDFYRDVHLTGISLIGAHTNSRPLTDSQPGQWTDHDDFVTFLKFVSTGRFNMEKLISNVISPAEGPAMYDRIINEKNPPLGIVFDWSKLQ